MPGGQSHTELLIIAGHPAAFAIPATRIAEQIGRRLILNVVMVGFNASVTRIMTADAGTMAISDAVTPATESPNLEVFEKGCLKVTRSVGGPTRIFFASQTARGRNGSSA